MSLNTINVKYSIFNHFSNYCFKLFCWVVILLRYNVLYWKNEKKKDFFSIWGKFFNVSLKNIFYKYFVHALAVLRLIILINSEIKTVWPVFTVSEKIKVVTLSTRFSFAVEFVKITLSEAFPCLCMLSFPSPGLLLWGHLV